MRFYHIMDIFQTRGGEIAIPLLVALGILVLGTLIHFRNLDARWRRAYLALSGIPLLLGIARFCAGLKDAILDSLGTAPEDPFAEKTLDALWLNLPILLVAAVATFLLLAGAVALFLPIRSWRPGTVAITWTASAALIFLSVFGAGAATDFILYSGWAFASASPWAFGLPPEETRGFISEMHEHLTEGGILFLILLLLTVAAIFSARANRPTRLKIAFLSFGVAVLMATLSALVVIKQIVVIYHNHPAIHGKAWVSAFGIPSW